MIVNIPIEPIEERYSADWGRWFEHEYKTRNLNGLVFNILPNRLRDDKIKEGAFLDVVGTTYFKAKQIEEIAGRIELGQIPRDERVVFLIHDGWFPVEQIAYMRDMLGCYDWKIVGIFHAGTYDRWDQTAQHGMYTWGEDLENAWFKIYDTIIVASSYHARLLFETRSVPFHKIAIIPWKVEVPQDLLKVKKMNYVIFPHRNNIEKQGDKFMWLKTHCPDGWEVITGKHELSGSNNTKRKYYENLAKSKIAISFSLQETFGIAMAEAVLLGCIPLVPDRLAYREYYPDCFRYKDIKDMQSMLTGMIHSQGDWNKWELAQLQDKFKMNSGDFFDRLFGVVDNV